VRTSSSKAETPHETLGLINGMIQRYAGSGDALDGLRWALPRVLRRLSAEAGSLFLATPPDSSLICVVCHGPVDVTGLRVAAGQGLVGRAFARGCAELVVDAGLDEAHDLRADQQSGFKTVATATAPVKLGKNRYGALQVINRLVNGRRGGFDTTDLSLLETLATALALAIANVRLTEKRIADQLLARDLEQARHVQNAFMPCPDSRGCVAGRVIPARDLSGDFVDYVEIDGKIAFCQGDVAGKGIAASLVMARVVTLFRQLARQGAGCTEIVCQINDELRSSRTDGYVTFVAGWFAPETAEITLINCGHGPTLQIAEDGTQTEFAAQTVPLGIVAFGKALPDPVTINLSSSSICMATDGVFEARFKGRELGVAGLAELLRHQTGAPADRQVEAVMRLFEAEKLKTHDDASLLVLRSPVS